MSRLLINPLAGRSYTKLPKELNHPRKGLINNIKNFDENDPLNRVQLDT